MQTFLEYAIHRVRQNEPKKLKNLYKLLKQGGLVVIDRSHVEHDPHLWVQAHPKPEEFDGIRVYLLGNICAFRVQKLETTEPYGKSYLMDLQKMYDDIIEDMGDKAFEEPDKAMKRLIKEVADKIRKFYYDSIKDEEEFLQTQLDGPVRSDIGGATILPNSGFDYSSAVYSTKN